MLRANVAHLCIGGKMGPNKSAGSVRATFRRSLWRCELKLLVRRGRTFALACADTRVEVLKGIPVRQVQERTGNAYAFRGDITAFG